MSEIYSKDEATQFFSEFYGGEHHFPGKVKEWGRGWCMEHFGDLATFDFTMLTRLVLMAHDQCVRVAIQPHHFKTIRICIWKRKREGSMSERHPTIEFAIAEFNKRKEP